MSVFILWLSIVAVIVALGIYAAWRIVKDKFKQFED